MSGSYFQPIKREFLNLSGGTVTGDTTFTLGLSVNTLSATTFYSGSTSLSNIFLTASDVSGTTLSQGSNISLSQSGIDYKVSIVDSPSFNNINFSGTATGLALSATTISGTTLRISGTAFIGSTSSVQWGDNAMSGPINGFLSMSSDGVFRFGDSAGGGSPRIIMGSDGASTGISLKRNGNSLDLRLGDDSEFASLNALSSTLGINGQTGTTMTVYGDLLVIGQGVSGLTLVSSDILDGGTF